MIGALANKGVNVSPKIYWHEWDIRHTQAVICTAGLSQELEDYIWEKDRNPFERF